MKRFLAFLLALTCLSGLVACTGNGGEDITTQKPSGSVVETTEKPTEAPTEESDEKQTETPTETTEEEPTEAPTEEPTTEEETEVVTEEPVPDVEANLPKRAPNLDYSAGDGYYLEQYDSADLEEYYAARAYFLEEGYVEYSSNRVGDARSTTFLKDDGTYATLMFNAGAEELYIGYGDNGDALPVIGGEYTVKNVTTVTQGYSSNYNGMTYIFHLADGSFIIIDGGYGDPEERDTEKQLIDDSKNLFNTLAKLHGKKSGMHIRAWLLTHSHNDHYPAFSTFSKTYASYVQLDCVMYSPLERSRAASVDTYFNDRIAADVARFEGAKLCGVHTGMAFDMADVRFEILYAPEMVYKDVANPNFNNSSIVCRVKNSEGAMMILGDIQTDGNKATPSEWLITAYGDALRSNMMQVAHHGVEQATPELYDIIAASTLFWPCDDNWLIHDARGTTTKQHLLCAEYAVEHILQSYGNATRPLSYVAEKPETLDLLESDKVTVLRKSGVANLKLTDGKMVYKVADGDPQVVLALDGVSTGEYNAIKLVVKATGYSSGRVMFTCGSDVVGEFTSARTKNCGPQGVNESGYHTMIVFFGNTNDYSGDLTSIRLDFGETVGEIVEIVSAELYYLDID